MCMLLEFEVTTLASIILSTVARMRRLCAKDEAFSSQSGRRPDGDENASSLPQIRLILATVDGILDARVVSYHIGTYRAQPAMEKINKTAHANIKGFQKVAAVKI